jgi:PmbA protein
MNDVQVTGTSGSTDIRELIQFALSEALAEGVDQAEAAASQDAGLSVTARRGEVENLEFTNDRGLWITVYKNQSKGSASTSDLSIAAVREAVRKACSFAGFTEADPYAGLADASLMCTDFPDLDLDHPWAIDAEQGIEYAIACEAAGLEFDPQINNTEGATLATNRGMRAYGNSHGFRGGYQKSSHSVSCALLAGQDGEMQRDYYYTAARDPAELEDIAAVGREAGRRTVARIGARKIKTRRAPVVYAADVGRSFIGHAIAAIAGGPQYRKSSFLLDAVGEKIFPSFVRIEERPHLPKGMASTAFDADGVATYDRDIVTDGFLREYVLSSYSARRLGLATTANAGGTQNLIVPGNGGGLKELLKEMNTGLLVEELIGQGVNTVTGDYSRGVVGHWVENGEIQYPVHEVTVAGNLRELYPRIERIGSDQDLRGGIRCGSILVGEMTIAGS